MQIQVTSASFSVKLSVIFQFRMNNKNQIGSWVVSLKRHWEQAARNHAAHDLHENIYHDAALIYPSPSFCFLEKHPKNEVHPDYRDHLEYSVKTLRVVPYIFFVLF